MGAEMMPGETTLQDFANQTPAERAAYWASFDAKMAHRRSLALGDTKPAAVAPPVPEPVAIVTPPPVIVFVATPHAPPADPIVEAEALAEAITASAALVSGGVFPSLTDAEALAEAFADVNIRAPAERISENDPNADAEALAASIVASAEMAGDDTGTPSAAEALAREIAARAPQNV